MPARALTADPTGFFRIGAGVWTAEGDAVVAVSGEQSRVLRIGPGGEVTMLSGPGSAASELRGVTSLFAVGEHLVAWDSQRGRLALFRDGSPEEVIPLRIPSRHAVVGLFADGTIVTSRAPGFTVFATADSVVEEGTPTVYELWDRRGNRVGELEGAPAPAPPYFRFVHRRDGSAIFSTDVHGGTCLPEVEHLVRDDRILIADGREGVLWALDRSGRRTELMRASARDTVEAGAVARLSEMIELTESYVEPVLDDAERTLLAQLGEPGDPLPSAWSALVEDSGDGSLWLRRAACFPEDPTETWDVVSPAGRPVASVRVPGNLRILAVVGEQVLAVTRDETGVEQVAVYRVVK